MGDIKLRYKITDRVTASFSVNNLWDETYFSTTLAAGRSCFGDLTFKF
ncbi:MAG: TonB-dependent receptor [Geobacteraceae bacterium]|nr:TonB-dependent receptor [Geobacteraceae bacterium]